MDIFTLVNDTILHGYTYVHDTRLHNITWMHTVIGQLSCNVLSARQLSLDLLTQTLLGDNLAAEYTLLHLLSSVYVCNIFPLVKNTHDLYTRYKNINPSMWTCLIPENTLMQ